MAGPVKQDIRFTPDAPPPIPAPALPEGLAAGTNPPDVPAPLRAVLSVRDNVPFADPQATAEGMQAKKDAERDFAMRYMSGQADVSAPDLSPSALVKNVQDNYSAAKQEFQHPKQPLAEHLKNLGSELLANTVGVDPRSISQQAKSGDVSGAYAGAVPALAQGIFLHKLGKPGALMDEAALAEHGAKVTDLVNRNGGATYNLTHGDLGGTNNYSVAAWPERDRLVPNGITPEDVSQFIKDNHDLLAHPNTNVGVYKRPDGKFQLEVSATTPVKKSAVEMGQKHNQISVFDLKRMEDIPTGGTGGILDAPARDNAISQVANEYNAANGRGPISGSYLPLDKEHASRIADAYEAAVHDPSDPAVQRSYQALINEVKAQWKHLQSKGFTMDTSPEQPYASAEAMLHDIRDNHHLSVWEGGTPPSDHPLSAIDPETGLSHNTLFRAVHDIMGHGAEGNDFSERGEENAWHAHRQMFSPDALPALTTETRGQASTFFNNKRVRGGAPVGEFPEQKATILPEEAQHRNEINRLSDIDFGPEKTPFSGRHYSAAKVPDSILSGARRGASRIGAEGNRLSLGRGAPQGVYVYRDGTIGEPMVTSRPYEYKVQGHKAIADISAPEWQDVMQQSFERAKQTGKQDGEARAIATNEVEHAIQEAGYDGYENRAYYPGSTFLFGDTPVSAAGEKVGVTARAGERGSDSLPKKVLSGNRLNGPEQVPQADLAGSGRPPAGMTPDQLMERALQNQGATKPFHQLPPNEQAQVVAEFKKLQAAGERKWFSPSHGSGLEDDTYSQIPAGKKTYNDDAAQLPVQRLAPRSSVQESPLLTNREQVPPANTVSPNGEIPVTRETPPSPQVRVPGVPSRSVSELNPTERAQLAARQDKVRQQFADNVRSLPPVKQFIAAAKAGSVGRLWYERSKQAFDAMIDHAPNYFKDGDRDKFLNTVASTSPQQSPDMNLREALKVWQAWNDRGRPTDFRGIAAAANDAGLTNLKSKLGTRQNPGNLFKALNSEDLLPETKKKYFKVGNFGRALSGEYQSAVHDSWMGVFAGLNEADVAKPQFYHALTQRTRSAAKALGWEPSEAQAAIWVFTRTLAELAGWKGTGSKRSPTSVLNAKDIFGYDFNENRLRDYADDFADIIKRDGETRSILKDLGVDLNELDAKLEKIPQAEAVPGGLSEAARRSLGPVAKRIGQAQAKLGGGQTGAQKASRPVRFTPDVTTKSSSVPGPISRAVSRSGKPSAADFTSNLF